MNFARWYLKRARIVTLKRATERRMSRLVREGHEHGRWESRQAQREFLKERDAHFKISDALQDHDRNRPRKQ